MRGRDLWPPSPWRNAAIFWVRITGDCPLVDPALVDALARAAEDVAVPYRRMPSGGGHDAQSFAAAGIPVHDLDDPASVRWGGGGKLSWRPH